MNNVPTNLFSLLFPEKKQVAQPSDFFTENNASSVFCDLAFKQAFVLPLVEQFGISATYGV